MADVFISYSRKDIEFVQHLHQELESRNREPWVDWRDIPPTAEWLDKVYAGIEAADTFLFIISPNSVISEICTLEIEHAIQHNKRLVPVVLRDVADNQVHSAMSAHNWVFLRGEDDFEANFELLIDALDTDLEYVREHTRLLTLAIEWDRNGRRNSATLRGQELIVAEDWFLQSSSKNPSPADLHQEYLTFSRAAVTRMQRLIVSSVAMALVCILGLSIFVFYQRRSETLLNDSLPKISEALDKGDNLLVFKLTTELLEAYPNNHMLALYREKATRPINIETYPDGIDVHISYGNDTIWNYLGKTPVRSVLVPTLKAQDFQLKFVVDGREFLGAPEDARKLNLNGLSSTPKGHAFIPGREEPNMWFPGIHLGKISYTPFSISKTEVSNIEFQAFVDSDGYSDPKYWDFPIEIDGTEYTWNKTIKRFTGKYGKAGPANWLYGKHPEHQGSFPVTGISWFEARAYARFKKMRLPNVFQWLVSARLSGFVGTLPNISGSNLNSTFLREVDDSRNTNFFGLKNMAGNVREWTVNPHGKGNNRFSILGGAYYDNVYNFNDYYSTSPLDRSLGNGCRLVSSLANGVEDSLDQYIISYTERDILSEEDVTDEVFEVYRAQFDYKDYPLEVDLTIIAEYDSEYVVERFEMETPYKNDEPLHGFIVYDSSYKGDLKPIIRFPSAGAIYTNSDERIASNAIRGQNYLLKEGYAVIHPVYYSTYNRRKTLRTWWANETEEYKESIIKIGKDYRRCIDYIESRDDFDFQNLSYVGFSWGSIMSNTLLAIDDRVKIAFVCVGGLQIPRCKREIDPSLFIRRIKIPVMHITGRLDGVFEYENSQIPMQKLLGTPKKDQKMIVLDGVGHGIPKDTVVVNHLEWLRKYETD